MSQPFRELVSVELTSTIKKLIECPEGMVIRIVGVAMTVNVVADGEFYSVQYTRDNTVLFQAGAVVTLGVSRVSGGIGQSLSVPTVLTTVVATGVNTFATQQAHSFSLVDIWFPFSIGINAQQNGGGSVSTTIVLFERQPMKRRVDNVIGRGRRSASSE